ncbi:MAG TPA: sodium:proton antiporter [Rhodobacteraceae bacterium]|nr:sodium:proton antiporter [Paracoccaceae bacterium]
MTVTRDDVLEILESIPNPVGEGSLAASGMVRALSVEGGAVRFVIEVSPDQAKAMEPARAEAEARLKATPGVTSVSAAMTAHSDKKPPDLQPKRKSAAPQGPQAVPGVDRILLVGSGKGGVGKSTVAANLACALAAEGVKVGLLDADIYGPSQPHMMGLSKCPASPDGKTIIPLQAHGVTCMSIGLMMNEGQAVVWRGPMLMGALQQMLLQVQWGELDVLVIDLPPGTGDVQLTLGRKFRTDGAIIVSTPQDVALLDARKAMDMFRQLKMPITGMVENMSTHICSNCGHEEHLFGHGGVAAEAEKLGVPLLGEIPLHLDVRVASDGGAPIVVSQPESPQACAFRDIARKLVRQEA